MTMTCLSFTFAHKTSLHVKMPYHKKSNILPDYILPLQAAFTKQLGVICTFIETKCSAQSAEMMIGMKRCTVLLEFFV